MTKRVEFEGRVHEFPDDFTDDEISAALSSSRPTPAPSRPQPDAPRARGGRDRETRLREFRSRYQTPVGAFVDQIGRRTGLGDEIAGIAASLTGGDRQAAIDASREETGRYAAAHPRADVAAQVGAGALWAGAPVAASGFLGRVAAGRGAPALAAQMTQGAMAGGLVGSAVGLSNAEGSLEERLPTAQAQGTIGAGIGAAAPPVLRAAAPAASFMVRQAERFIPPLPRIGMRPNAVGALGGNLTVRPGQRPPPRLNPNAIGTIDRLAARTQMTPEAIEGALAGARTNPQGQVLADVFGQTGVRTLRPIIQSPGETTERAARTVRTRVTEAPERIMRALTGRLGVGESRHAALARLQDEYRTVGAEMYRPVFAQQLSAEQAQSLEQGIQALMGTSVMRRAATRAQQLMRDDAELGLISGASPAARAHYLKLAVDSLIGQGRRVGSMQSVELRQAMEVKRRLLQAIDANVPGYGAARQQWAGLAEAEEALDLGVQWLRLPTEEVRAMRQGMSEFELRHARVGLADAIRDLTRGKVVGNQNVAARLDDAGMQRAIAAAFDTPEQAAAFLDTVNTQNELTRNAIDWIGGSSSASNIAFGADEALNAAGDMAGAVLSGNPGTAANQAGRGAWRAFTSGLQERANNARGEALLTRVDIPESEQFAREVVAELKRRAQIRAQAGRAGAIGGQTGQRRD